MPVRNEHPEAKLLMHEARDAFTSAIEKLAPEVLDDLQQKPLRDYLATGIATLTPQQINSISYRRVSHFWHNLERGEFGCHYTATAEWPDLEQRFLHEKCTRRFGKLLSEDGGYYLTSDIYSRFRCPKIVALWKSLLRWSRKWNVAEKEGVDKWVIRTAFCTLASWSFKPQERGQLEWSYISGNDWKENAVAPPEGLPEWLLVESRDSYLARVQELVRDEIAASQSQILKNERRAARFVKLVMDEAEAYCEQVRNQEQSKTEDKEVRDRPELIKHVEWTAKFQVKKQSLNSIAKAVGVNTSSVKREVDKALELIGIERRITRRGILPGTKKAPMSVEKQILRHLGR